MAFGLRRPQYFGHPLRLAGLVVLEGLKRCTSGPVRRAVVVAIAEMKVAVCHARGRGRTRALLARGERLRLNVGCGGTRRPGWIGIDLNPAADLQLDIRRSLPFPDGSCLDIYAEHVLEHLAYPGEVEEVLRDWLRLLVPGGRLSIGVPDTAEPLACYLRGERAYFDGFHVQPNYPTWNVTALDHVNFHFRQQAIGFGQDHLYAYDLETLVARLTAAGFTAVQRRDFDPARDCRPGTLYVDAVKRGG